VLAAAAAFVVVAGVPARALAGDSALVFCLTATGICLVPALLTLVLVELLFVANPQWQGLAMVGSSGLRIVLVMLAAVCLYFLTDYFHRPAFLFWVGAAYIYLLIIEVWLLVQSIAVSRPSAGSEG
jgi:hypothetical protein